MKLNQILNDGYDINAYQKGDENHPNSPFASDNHNDEGTQDLMFNWLLYDQHGQETRCKVKTEIEVEMTRSRGNSSELQVTNVTLLSVVMPDGTVIPAAQAVQQFGQDNFEQSVLLDNARDAYNQHHHSR
jgi:hypothetical protein